MSVIVNPSSGGGSGARTVLAVATTFYVRTDGSDSNNGLSDSPSGAFLTFQHGYNILITKYDFGGQNVVLTAGSEAGTKTFAGIWIQGPWSGGGSLTISGNASAANTTMNNGGDSFGDAIGIIGQLGGTLYINNITLTSSTEDCLNHSGVGLVSILGGVVFGAAASQGIHIDVFGTGAVVDVNSNYTISGDAKYHIASSWGGFVSDNILGQTPTTVTVSGTRTFTAFVQAAGGYIEKVISSYNVTGTVSGNTYLVLYDGSIQTASSSITYFPGNVAGTIQEGSYRASTNGYGALANRALSGDAAGNVVIGTSAISTSATDGFLYLESAAGTPIGVPTTYTGRVPFVYDATNRGIWAYDNAWKLFRQNSLMEREAPHLAPWDDFDAADGTSLTSRVSPSGFTWSTTGTGAAGLVITSQGVLQSGVSVGYGYMSDSQVITQCECIVSWLPGSAQSGFSSGNTVIAFSGQNGANLLNYLLHLQINAQNWNLLKTTTGAGGLVPLANPPVEVNGITGNAIGVWFGTNLKIDGTRYKIRMTVNQSAGILTLYLPDGLTLQYTDPDITTIMAACQTALIEPDPDGITTQATVYVNGFGIGPSKAGDVIEASSSKDTAIVRQLYATLGATAGNGGYSPRQESYQMFTGTTAGWYTIATESIDTSHVKMGGIVTLFGRDVAGRQVFQKIHVGYQSANGVPYYMFWTECFFNSVSGSSVIDLLRLSADDTGHHIQLDIHINDASPSTTNIFCNYEGYFTPVAAPVVGASPLATWNQVLANQGAYYSYLPQMGNPGQVGDLPPAADVPVGTPAFVTNSNATLVAGLGNTVAGGGANKVPVYSDGTNWIIG